MKRVGAIETLILAVIVAAGVAGSPGAAQERAPSVRVTAPPPALPPSAPQIRFEPAIPPEQTGAREQEFYPGQVRARHEPAFVVPFVATMPVSRSEAVRIGFSGWTAPAVPFDIPQASGGVAFGLTFSWGVPVPETEAPQPEMTEER